MGDPGFVGGLLGWGVSRLLDEVIRYVVEANKVFEHCEDLHNLLGTIQPLVSECTRNRKAGFAAAWTSSRSSPPSAGAVDAWLGDLEPLLQESATKLRNALAWVKECHVLNKPLAIREKKKWSNEIREVTVRIRKAGQDGGIYAVMALQMEQNRTVSTAMARQMEQNRTISKAFEDISVSMAISGLKLVAAQDDSPNAIELVAGAHEFEDRILQVVGHELVKGGICGSPNNHIQAIIKKEMEKFKAAVQQGQMDTFLRSLQETPHLYTPRLKEAWDNPVGSCQILSGSSFPDPVRFTAKVLRAATNNFAHRLGEGGFSYVYRGRLITGDKVAVKVMKSQLKLSSMEFVSEIQAMSGCQHVNILRLCGYHIGGPLKAKGTSSSLLRAERKRISKGKTDASRSMGMDIAAEASKTEHVMLVLEYMHDGRTLYDHLHWPERIGVPTLGWSERLKIIKGIAQGLVHLHGLSIVHRDIKPSNIFLDKYMCPKIGDFGIACVMKHAHEKTTALSGTAGFLDPHYYFTDTVTMKADVYSFGVTVLSIVTGKKAFDYWDESADDALQHLPQAVGELRDRGMPVLDPKMEDRPSQSEVSRIIEVALLCVRFKLAARPTMQQALCMIRGSQHPEEFATEHPSHTPTEELSDVEPESPRCEPPLLCDPANNPEPQSYTAEPQLTPEPASDPQLQTIPELSREHPSKLYARPVPAAEYAPTFVDAYRIVIPATVVVSAWLLAYGFGKVLLALLICLACNPRIMCKRMQEVFNRRRQ